RLCRAHSLYARRNDRRKHQEQQRKSERSHVPSSGKMLLSGGSAEALAASSDCPEIGSAIDREVFRASPTFLMTFRCALRIAQRPPENASGWPFRISGQPQQAASGTSGA